MRGFFIADDRNFSNFTDMSSWPDEFLVRYIVRYLVASVSSTSLKVDDVKTRSFMYVSYPLLFSVVMLLANFGPISQKNSLNLLHISVLSTMTFDPTIIFSNSFLLTMTMTMTMKITLLPCNTCSILSNDITLADYIQQSINCT